jgi:positive regulator of sigma E activity
MDLDFSFLENKHEAQAFMYSAGVIVLSVIAVVAFIVSGGGILFYVFAVLAVALGFYMAYHISKTPAQAAAAPARRKQAKR